ncbi:hypothetical protein BCO37747_08138 [Burkholderia contaminans]|nr:hypothetical protein BCO37747_08138 [Burkholderia contaminans]
MQRFGFVRGQPAQQRAGHARRDGIRCGGRTRGGPIGRVRFAHRARVGPQERGTHRLPRHVDQHDAVHLPREPDRRHLRTLVGRQPRGRAHERLPPRVRRDLRPAGLRRRQRIRFARDRPLDAIGIERDEFDGAGAEVDSEQAHDVRANSNERMSMITGSRCAPRFLPSSRQAEHAIAGRVPPGCALRAKAAVRGLTRRDFPQALFATMPPARYTP